MVTYCDFDMKDLEGTRMLNMAGKIGMHLLFYFIVECCTTDNHFYEEPKFNSLRVNIQQGFRQVGLHLICTVKQKLEAEMLRLIDI